MTTINSGLSRFHMRRLTPFGVPRLCLPLAILAAACQGEQANDPQSPNAPTAFDATSTPPDSTASAGSNANAASLATRAFDPVGFSPIAVWDMSGLMPVRKSSGPNSSLGISAGVWYRSSGSLGLGSDASAPHSPKGVLVYTWPAGLPPGTSPGFLEASFAGHKQYGRIYEEGWIKIPSKTFEVHGPSGGLKLLGLWGSGNSRSSGNNNFGWMAGVGSNPAHALKFELRQQNFVTRNLYANTENDATFSLDAWHHYEILLEVNDIGARNGRFRMWLDGKLTHDYHDVVYRTSRFPAKFFARKFDATWGGAGGRSKRQTDRLLIDELAVLGAD
jgi:hypothetical protein